MDRHLPEMRFATARLTLRPAPASVGFLSDLEGILSPRVTAFLPPELGAGDDRAAWLDRARAGGPVLAAFDASGLVGLLLLHVARTDHVMLGYLLGEDSWGRGYATEMLRGLVGHLRASAWAGKLSGGVDPDNAASERVLVKAGFAPTADRGPDGSVFYRLKLP